MDAAQMSTLVLTWDDHVIKVPSPQRLFAVDIDPSFFNEFTGTVQNGRQVSRKVALSVPAAQQSRNVVAGGIGQLPLDAVNETGPPDPARQAFLRQPEGQWTPAVVTMAMTVEDLMMDKRAYWRVDKVDWRGYPASVTRLDVDKVTTKGGELYYEGKRVRSKVIVFESPKPGLLDEGSRAINNLLTLDKTSLRNAQGRPPIDYFTPTDGFNMTEEQVIQFLSDWKAAREKGATGYIPDGLEYHVNGFDPEKSGLGAAKDYAVLEIARQTGLDAEYLGVSVTSRTYANMFERRKWLTDFTLAPYYVAIEQRLSMNDVTPAGTSARFNLDAFLRGSTQERYDAHETAIRIGLYGLEYAQQLEGLPAYTPPTGSETAS